MNFNPINNESSAHLLPIPPCLATHERIRSLALNLHLSTCQLTEITTWLAFAASSNQFKVASTLFSLAAHAGNCRLVRAVWPHLAPSELSNHEAVQAFHSAAVKSDSNMIATLLEIVPDLDLSDSVSVAASFGHTRAIDMLLRHARVHTDRETERALVETALWRACCTAKVAVVEFLIERHGAEASHEHMLQVISGGPRRMRRNEVELLVCSIVETMLATSPLCRSALVARGPTLLARCVEMGHKRLFRLLLGHGARAYDTRDPQLLEAAIGARDDHFLRTLIDVGVRVDDCRTVPLAKMLSTEQTLKCSKWASQSLTTAQWRQKVAALLRALRIGRIVLQRSTRGDFDRVTRWLDIDLLSAFGGEAPGVVSERELRAVSHTINMGVFFETRTEAINELIGWRALSSTTR